MIGRGHINGSIFWGGGRSTLMTQYFFGGGVVGHINGSVFFGGGGGAH